MRLGDFLTIRRARLMRLIDSQYRILLRSEFAAIRNMSRRIGISLSRSRRIYRHGCILFQWLNRFSLHGALVLSGVTDRESEYRNPLALSMRAYSYRAFLPPEFRFGTVRLSYANAIPREDCAFFALYRKLYILGFLR